MEQEQFSDKEFIFPEKKIYQRDELNSFVATNILYD
jgi:hypothetical protein